MSKITNTGMRYLNVHPYTKTKVTCKMGTFIFKNDGTISLQTMKRIRDSVMGQRYTPAPGTKRLRTVGDVYEFVRVNLRIEVPFKFQTNY
jgi:hypothetical protein